MPKESISDGNSTNVPIQNMISIAGIAITPNDPMRGRGCNNAHWMP